MKVKISEIDPTGVSLKTKDFYIPFMKKNVVQLIHLKDGTTIKGEPMKISRYLLEIGEYKYIVYRSGKIILIEDSMS